MYAVAIRYHFYFILVFIHSRPIMAARHDSQQLSTCTTDGKLIVVIGESRRMSVRWNNAYSADFDIIIQRSQTVAFCL